MELTADSVLMIDRRSMFAVGLPAPAPDTRALPQATREAMGSQERGSSEDNCDYCDDDDRTLEARPTGGS